MKQIPLTQGQFAIVDDCDFDWLNCWRWCAAKNHYGYVTVRNCRCPFTKKCHLIYMHRQIMNCPQDKQIDHCNHDTLNNRRTNLRICTHSENRRNSKKYRDNTSGFKGVHWQKGQICKGKQYDSKWRASIGFNNKRIHLGYFNSKIEAAKAYDKAAQKHFGEFAKTNF